MIKTDISSFRKRLVLSVYFFFSSCFFLSGCLISFNEDEIKPPKISDSAVKKKATYNLLDYSSSPFTEELSVRFFPDPHSLYFQNYFGSFLSKRFTDFELNKAPVTEKSDCHFEAGFVRRQGTETDFLGVIGILNMGIVFPYVVVEHFDLDFSVYKNAELIKEYNYNTVLSTNAGIFIALLTPFADSKETMFEKLFTDPIDDLREKLIKDCGL
ncbi:MAG TPA: hypothetical protein PL048_13465 [Leptospiraceae bacterium]|nr:hypothetical protein [Leptospiraceae bacterium]